MKANITVDLNYIRDLEEENKRLKDTINRANTVTNDIEVKLRKTEKELRLAKQVCYSLIQYYGGSNSFRNFALDLYALKDSGFDIASKALDLEFYEEIPGVVKVRAWYI